MAQTQCQELNDFIISDATANSGIIRRLNKHKPLIWLIVASVIILVHYLLYTHPGKMQTNSLTNSESCQLERDYSRLVPFVLANLICLFLGIKFARRLIVFHVLVWHRLLWTDFFLTVFGLIMVALVWGYLDLGFGLFYIFWHDWWWMQMSAGIGVGMFWMLLGYVAYLLFVRDIYERMGQPPDPRDSRAVRHWKTLLKFGATVDPTSYRGHMVFWLISPLLVLSFVPVINGGSEMYDLQGKTGWRDGFCRMINTIGDRWSFGVGLVLGTGIFELILDVWNRCTLGAKFKHPVRTCRFSRGWDCIADQLALLVQRLIAVLLFAAPISYGVLKKMIFPLAFSATVIVLALVFYGVAFDGNTSNLSQPLFGLALATVLLWLSYFRLNPPNDPRPCTPVREWTWLMKVRARNLFLISSLVMVGIHLVVLVFDIGDKTVVTSQYDRLHSAFFATLFLMALVNLYTWLRYYRRGRALLTAAAVIVVLGISNGTQHYKHQLDGLDRYYEMDSVTESLPDDQYVPGKHKPSLYHYDKLRGIADKAANDGDPSKFIALKNREVLRKWDEFVREQAKIPAAMQTEDPQNPTVPKPPLIIVTTSGGASNSAIFTLNVLLELERIMPGFSRHIRIISGASGGMLGASYFRSKIDYIREVEDKYRSDLERTVKLNDLRWRISRDVLGSILQQWIFKDMAMGFMPIPYQHDRGSVLEKAWETLLGKEIGTTFDQLKEQEKDGKRPSLILSPTLVEDGRQLLISTLDLDELVHPGGRRDNLNDGVERYPTNDPDDPVQKYKAVEFFKLFPEAKSFKLSTAVRLNCSFPFVAPAGSLPTSPPRRVADAGYYDNHGMNVAVSWVYQNQDWLRHNTSEVIILQIRPWSSVFCEDADRHQVSPAGVGRFDRPLDDTERAALFQEGKPKNWNNFGFGFDEVTTPVDGGYASLRSAMIFRNTQQLRLLQKVVHPAGDFKGVTSYTFVGNLESSMNWCLPHYQVLRIEAAVRQAADEGWRPTVVNSPSKRIETPWYLDKWDFQAAKKWNRGQFEALKNSDSLKHYIRDRK